MSTALRPDITRGEKFVGLFVIGALVITGAFITLTRQSVLQTSRSYWIQPRESYGLTRGSKVLLYGFPVGEITAIELKGPEQVRIDFRVDGPDLYNQIKTDGKVEIQAPLGGGAITPGALILLPGTNEDVKGDADSMAFIPPRTTASTVMADAALVVEQFKQLVLRINDPDRAGMLELLGRDNATQISSMIDRGGQMVDQDLAEVSSRVRHMVTDLDDGTRSISDILFKGRPLLQVLLGDRVQDKLDNVAAGESALLEILVGPTVWNEVEVASRAWDTLFQSSLALLDETRLLLRKTQVALDDVEPVLAMFGDNVAQLEEMLSTTRGMLADIRTVTASVSDVSDEIPTLTRQLEGVLANSNDLLEAFKRHWLISGFLAPEPQEHFGLRQTQRPNPYGE
ncbi:MAG: MlaD family protein [Planctomycetota bacterium]